MTATKLTLDLMAYNMPDDQLIAFTRLFKSILTKAHVEHLKGNVTFSLDGKGHFGPLKIESFEDVVNSNGNHSI